MANSTNGMKMFEFADPWQAKRGEFMNTLTAEQWHGVIIGRSVPSMRAAFFDSLSDEQRQAWDDLAFDRIVGG